MPARPRGSARVPSRRIPSTIRKMDKHGKGSTPPPPLLQSRVRSNPPRRRSRSPRPTRKSNLPRSPLKRRMSLSPVKRRVSLSPKRNDNRKSRDDMRLPPKRPRDLSKSRTQPPRKHPPDKKYLDKPVYDGPGKECPYTKEDLKKITKSISRDFPGGSKQINRTLVHPEDVRIPRRPGEGSAPIFHRQEIIENKRKYDEYDIGPSHSDRLHYEPSTSYNDNFRVRDYYSDKEKERSVNNSRRSPREYDYKSRDDRTREEVRYQTSVTVRRSRSYERPRDYPPERKERYDERDVHRGSRRSLERDRRSDDRPMRRHPSPGEPRRYTEHYRDYDDRRARSLERRDVETSHYRDQDYPPGDRFSNADRSSKSGTYHKVDGRENPSSSSRGRGGGFYQRGRGGTVSGRPFSRHAGFVVGAIPPVRAPRGVPIARGLVVGGRLPFPPRKSFRGSLQGRR